jgi:hypothetical protein
MLHRASEISTLKSPSGKIWKVTQPTTPSEAEDESVAMGITGLWNEIQEYGVDVSVSRLHESVQSSSSAQVKVGIDISLWIVHACTLNVDFSNRIVRVIFYRLCRLLQLPQLQPVFVFDGSHKPDFKRGKLVSKSAWDDSKVQRYADRIKKLIEAFGFSYVQAPGEAEAELGNLCRTGAIDAVMSDDADCFAFGATTVVRNWSSGLSGSKARSAHIIKTKVGSPSLSSASGSSDDEVFDVRRPSNAQALDLEELRKNDNLTTVYRTTDMPDGLDRDGCILVALLSGGDYDTKGVQKCGEKTAVSMARAGFGKRLIAGASKYLKVTPDFGRYNLSAPPPHKEKGWDDFLCSWRKDLVDELKSNRSGFMSRKQVKLAQSNMVESLLTSDASLRLLASYIWPVVSTADALLVGKQKSPDVKRIAALASILFGWEAEKTHASLRNSVWLGCLYQHLHGRVVKALESGKIDNASSPRKLHVKHDEQAGRRESAVSPESSGIAILRQRAHVRTGYMQEVYVEFGVVGLAEDVEVGLVMARNDDGLQILRRSSTPDNLATPSSSQVTSTASTPSPRKKKQPEDVRKPMREWVALASVEASEEGRKAIAVYRRKETQKAALQSRKEKNRSPSRNQRTLNDFFKTTVPKPLLAVKNTESQSIKTVPLAIAVKDAKLSPSKRLANSSPRNSVERFVPTSTSKKKIARPLSPSPTKANVLEPPGHITISDDSDDGDESNDQPIFVRKSVVKR